MSSASYDAIRCDFGVEVLEIAPGASASRLVGKSTDGAVAFDLPLVDASGETSTFGPRDDDGAFFRVSAEAQVLRVWVSDALPVPTDCACNAEFRARAAEPTLPPPGVPDETPPTAPELAGVWDLQGSGGSRPADKDAHLDPRWWKTPNVAAHVAPDGRTVTIYRWSGSYEDYVISHKDERLMYWYVAAVKARPVYGGEAIILSANADASELVIRYKTAFEVFRRRRASGSAQAIWMEH
jgi:hypothetical protein